MKTKICAKCKQEKSIDEFNNNVRTKCKFGKHYYCKPCKSIASKKEYSKHKEKYIERCNNWRKTEVGKASLKKTYAKAKAVYPEKYKARTLLNNAITNGRITRETKCQICSQEGVKIYGHHEDYSKPLEVKWVCHSCHMNIHIYHNS